MSARKSTQATQAPVEAPAEATQEAPQAPEGNVTVEAIAGALNVTQKDVRRWLRTNVRLAGAGDTLPGKGGRYAFTQAQAEAIIGAYASAKARKGTTAPAEALLAFLAPSQAPEAPEA